MIEFLSEYATTVFFALIILWIGALVKGDSE